MLLPPIQLFALYVTRREAGERIDFEEYCAEHEHRTDELYGLHADWDNVAGLLRRVDLALRTRRRTLFAVENVGTRYFLLAVTHQCEFDLVLDIFDMDGPTRGHPALEGGRDLVGQLGYRLVDP